MTFKDIHYSLKTKDASPAFTEPASFLSLIETIFLLLLCFIIIQTGLQEFDIFIDILIKSV